MSDNYAVINGKRIELTDTQAKVLGIETPKNPFERVKDGDTYYRVTEYGNVDDYVESGDYTDHNLYKTTNYFNDDSVAQQVALHQLLYRKLLKFIYDYGCEDNREWDGDNKHHYIFYDYSREMFGIKSDYNNKAQVVYFSSSDAAVRAIKEVVEPFMKEHPDFVW